MKKITQTTLAELLNISRTTVARALNNHPCVDESTRKIIMDKARELGYVQPSLRSNQQISSNREIALLGNVYSTSLSFWGDILHNLEQHLRSKGFNLRLLFMDIEQINNCQLPEMNSFSGVDGIVVMGNIPQAYYLSLWQLGLPIVSYDMPIEMATTQPIVDVVSLNNSSGIQLLTKRIIDKGHTKIAFAGHAMSSASFFERYQGFENTMQLNNLTPINVECLKNITPESSRVKEEALYKELNNTSPESRATAYICANDSIAHSLYDFKIAHKELMGDAIITGFDNEPSHSKVLDATVNSHTKDIGKLLGIQMCNRLENKELKITVSRLNVTPIFNDTLK